MSLIERNLVFTLICFNSGDPNKVEHLKALEGAEERLQLYEADLLKEGSFDSVVDGCDGVFHTASPVSLSVSDPQVRCSSLQNILVHISLNFDCIILYLVYIYICDSVNF